jgi:hypothetical protein
MAGPSTLIANHRALEASVNRNAIRSVLAGLAGIATAVIPTLAADALAHKIGPYPPVGQPVSDLPFVPATIYRVLFGIAGSYVTARLAPNRPMLHSMVLGAIGLLVAIAGTIATWNRGPEFGPHWYPIALVALSLPQSWAGAKIWLSQTSSRS